MTLVHLFVGLLLVWFTFHAVADHIKEQKLKKFMDARDDEGPHDRVAEKLQRDRR